jgi:hypothetical protein
MRTSAQKPTTPHTTSAKTTTPGWAHFGQSREVNPIPHSRGAIGTQVVQQLRRGESDGREAASDATPPGRFGHDFSRIPMHSTPFPKPQSELAVNT